MWCIPNVTPEFVGSMEEILELYAKPYDTHEPVLCCDEQSTQLLKDTSPVKHTKEGQLRRRDYEYERNGTRNIVVTVEPKGGHREVTVTERRQKPDFAKEITRIIELPRYRHAATIHIVLDNLNTHFEKSFIDTFGKGKSARIMRRVTFHDTPKHASWLNMAEMELGIFSRQSIKGRIPTAEALRNHASLWQQARNQACAMIRWKFTVWDAQVKFQYNSNGSELN